MSERLLRLTYKRHKNLIKYHRACLKNWAVIVRKSFFEKSKDKYRMFSIRSLLYVLSKTLNYCSMSAIFQFNLHIYMLFEGGRSVSRKTFWVFWLRPEAISLDVYISYIVLSELKPKMSSEGMRAVYNSGSVSLNIARAYISNQIIGFRIPNHQEFSERYNFFYFARLCIISRYIN